MMYYNSKVYLGDWNDDTGKSYFVLSFFGDYIEFLFLDLLVMSSFGLF